MKNLTMRLAVLLLSTLGLLTGGLLAQQSPPSDDTYVSSTSPKTKFGSSVLLVVGQGSTTYMRFNLSGVPAGAPVSKATLRLFVSAVATGGQFDVYNLPATPTWSESTLTFNTPPPALGSSATGGNPVTVSTSSMNNFVLVDITATVQNWLANPSSNNGVALAVVSTKGYFSFESKEGLLTSHEPELEIVLNGSSGAGSGTVTSVGSGLGLTGGPITTTGTLNINPNVVPQLGALNNVFTGNISALSFTGNGAGLTNVNASTLNGVAGYNFPSLTGSNNFVGNQTITGNLNIAGIGSTLNVGGPSVFNMDVTPGPAVTSNCLASAGAACTGFQFNGLPGNTIFNAQINGTPEMTVDAGGNMTLNGAVSTAGATLPPLGTATSASAFNSNALNLVGSSFNGSSAVPEKVALVFEPLNNSSSPSGSLNLLFGQGTGPLTETGFSIGTGGVVNFVPGQTFGTTTITANNALSVANAASSAAANAATTAANAVPVAETYANSMFVPLAGGTMTGALNVPTLSSPSVLNITSPADIKVKSNGTMELSSSALLTLSSALIDLSQSQVLLGSPTANSLFAGSIFSGPITLGIAGTSGISPSKSAPLMFQGISTSSTNYPAEPFFQWQLEPAGINTPNPSGTLNLLYGGDFNANAVPAETGLSIAGNGIIHFAAGQTFQGGGSGGGITSVAGTNGVKATTSGGAVTLSADQGVVAFQSDLSSAVNTAENFSVTQTVNYTDTYFLHLAGGAMTGTLTVPVIGVGTASPAFPLDVNGVVNTSTAYNLGGTFFDYGSAASNNAFLGFAGNSTNPGAGNVAAGWHALAADTTGGSNVAAGYLALNSNTTGSFNVALGNFAGQTGDSSPITGNNNTFLGGGAEASYGSNASGAITNATAIGSNSVVGESNALVLGSIAGQNSATKSVNVGIGTPTPQYALDVHGTGSFASLLVNGQPVTGGGGTITGVTAGSGLAGGGTSGNVPVSLASCPSGQVLQSGGPGSWGCATVSGGGGGITETGTITTNSLPLFSSTINAVTSSNVTQDASGKVGIGTATPQAALDVNGAINAATGLSINGAPALSEPGVDNITVGLDALAFVIAPGLATTGSGNTAVGRNALMNSGEANLNTAVGINALASISGSNNTALGATSGATIDLSPIDGTGNTFLGFGTKLTTDGLSNGTPFNYATAVGANAVVGESNALVLGSISNMNNCTNSCASTSVGIGTPTPQATFDVEAASGTPSVNFFVSSTPGTFTVNGTTSITGATTISGGLTVTGGCNGCGGGGSGGSGTVTSVAVAPGGGLLASSNPITTSGSLSIDTTKVPLLGASINNFTGEISTTGLFAGSVSTFGTVGAGSYTLEGTTVLAHAPSTGGSLLLGENTGNSNLLSSFDSSNTTAIGDFTMRFYTSGSDNTALGNSALYQATSGSGNTGAGYGALYQNTSGSNNTAMGYDAGMPSVFENTTGSNNTFLGASSGPGTQPALSYATAIGANSVVSQPNALVLGSIAGVNGCDPSATIPCLSTKVGIGTAAPSFTLDVEAPSGTPAPSVNFGSASNPATFTVNGTTSIAGNLTVTGTCTGCGGSGGGSGTITGVTAGTGLTGGGTSGNVTLSLNTSVANTFTGTQTFNVPTGNGIVAQTAGNSNAGISGSNTSPLGSGAGVAGFTVSGSGSGVVGTNSSSSLGGGYGVQGLSYNAAVAGVGGINNSPSAGSAYGVFGQSSGSNGTGVYGTGNGSGVTGSTSSPTGTGVVATNFATSGSAYGVFAQSTSSPGGTGVYGTGTGTGVSGFTSAGYGVVGQSNGTVSGSAGVYGLATTAAGIGVLGSNNAGGWAGFFSGPVLVQGGALQSTGDVNFQGNAAVGGNASIGGNAAVTGTLAIGGDTPMSHSPRMFFNSFVAGSFANNPNGGYFISDQAITVIRVTGAGALGQSCTTSAQVEFLEITPNPGTILYTFTLSGQNSGRDDSGPLLIPIPAGVSFLERASGCNLGGQAPADENISVQYVMQ